MGRAIAPAGASTGSAEAVEKRMIGFEELWDINDMASIREMERKYAV